MNESTEKQRRKKGQHLYFHFSAFNGISVSFAAENLLILYALKLNVPDYIIGIMASFFFLSAPFMLLSPRIIKRFGASGTIAIAWLCRYTFAMFFLAAPFVMTYFSFTLGIALLVVCAFGLYASRNCGIVAWMPVLGELTTGKDKGMVLSKGFLFFTTAYFLSLCCLRFLFEYIDTVNTFRSIIAVGCIAGFLASFTISRITETDTARNSANHSIRDALCFIKNKKTIMILILVQIIYFGAVSIFVPYSMLALKQGYFVQDYNAVTYVIIQVSGSLLLSVFGKKILELIKAKYVVIILYFIFIIVALLWIFAPVTFFWWYCLIIFALLGIARVGGFMSLAHYFLEITPGEMRVGVNLVLSVVSCSSAGLVGSLFGGGLLKYLVYLGIDNLNLYKHFFIIMLIFSIIGLILMLYLERINPIKSLALAKKIFIK